MISPISLAYHHTYTCIQGSQINCKSRTLWLRRQAVTVQGGPLQKGPLHHIISRCDGWDEVLGVFIQISTLSSLPCGLIEIFGGVLF